MHASERGPLLILGAGGRVGRLVSPHWPGDVVQQTRGAAPGPGWVSWSPATGPLPALPGGIRAMIILAGVTPASGPPLDENAAIAEACVQAAQRAGLSRVLLVSTQAVYGAPEGRGFRETDAPRPVSDYGRTKLEAEEACQASDLDVTILRLGNVAGADQLLINARTATGETPVILDQFSDGATPRRSYIAPDTLAKVLEHIADMDSPPPVINVAAPVPVTMRALLEAAGVPMRLQPAPASAVKDLTLDCSLLERTFSFAPGDSDPVRMAATWRAVA